MQSEFFNTLTVVCNKKVYFRMQKQCQSILGCEDNGKDLGGLLLPLVSMAIGYRCMFVAKII